MIETRTSFNPFKMKIGRKEPVVLSVELSNTGVEQEIVSLDLDLGKQFSLERTGFKATSAKRMPEFKPGTSKKFYFDIWPKQMLRQGERNIALRITEHYRDFNYIKRKHDRMLKLSVDE